MLSNLVNPLLFRLNITNYCNYYYSSYNLKNYRYKYAVHQILIQLRNLIINSAELSADKMVVNNTQVFVDNKLLNIIIHITNREISQLLQKAYLSDHFSIRMWYSLIFQPFLFSFKDVFSCFFNRINHMYKYTNNVNIDFVWSINPYHITSEIITFYMKYKIEAKDELFAIMRPILKDLNFRILKNAIFGYRIKCKGNFRRGFRSSIKWFKKEIAPLGSYSQKIDYCERTCNTRYGICQIKVWLILNKDFRECLNQKYNRYLVLILRVYTLYKGSDQILRKNKQFALKYNLLKKKYTEFVLQGIYRLIQVSDKKKFRRNEFFRI